MSVLAPVRLVSYLLALPVGQGGVLQLWTGLPGPGAGALKVALFPQTPNGAPADAPTMRFEALLRHWVASVCFCVLL